MARYFTKVLPLLLIASSYVSALPTSGGSLLETRDLPGFKKTLKTAAATFDLPGVKWATIGVSTANPNFETFEVTATGMTSQLSISVDRAQGIVIADHLCRDKVECPDARLTDLIKAFISDEHLTLNYLAIHNIQETSTRELIYQIPKDIYLTAGSTAYLTLTTKSPLGRIGKSSKLGVPKGLYIGDAAAAKPGMEQAGGPTMVFLYAGVTVPKALTEMDTAGAGPSSGIYGASKGKAQLTAYEKEQRAKTKDKQSKAAAAALANPPNTNTHHDDAGCECVGCKCTMMKRDFSSGNTTPFKRNTEYPKQSRNACPTCCKCKA